MADEWPKIHARRTTTVSPWMDVIAREVEFAAGAELQTYHAVGQRDYLAIVALTPERRIPIVRQYRPAVEAFTWELPAGLLEPGEVAGEACRRELAEETGLTARDVRPLGIAAACTGRLSNRVHSFFVAAGPPAADFRPEAGMTVALKTQAELVAMIKSGEFVQQLHLGALLLAEICGYIALPR